LTGITVPESVTRIESQAFAEDSNLTGIYFKGNAPTFDSHMDIFSDANRVTAYYLPWTLGWDTTFAGRPTAPWLDPQRSGAFWFPITGPIGQVVEVEASTKLVGSLWVPVATNTLINGSSYFHDPYWTNYPSRFYRLRWR
jgi:hypothetical protein